LTGTHHHAHHHHAHHHHAHDSHEHSCRLPLDCDQEHVPPVPLTDHDSDAIYLIAQHHALSNGENISLDTTLEPHQLLIVCDIENTSSSGFLKTSRCEFSSGPPIYLLHAALRL
jgi:hypothetical protein